MITSTQRDRQQWRCVLPGELTWVVCLRALRAFPLEHLEQEPLLHLSPGARRWRLLLTGQVLRSLAQLAGAGLSGSLRPTQRCHRLSPAASQSRGGSELQPRRSSVCRREAGGRRHREGPGPAPPASLARSW